MRSFVQVLGPVVLAAGLAVPLTAGDRPAEGTPAARDLFRARVRGVLTARCFKCHGGRKTEGKLDIATREKLLKGGKHGPALVPYEPDRSRLFLQASHFKKPYMPPKEWLTEKDLRDLHAWIAGGAPYDGVLGLEATAPRPRPFP